jgi:hypothetical protein
MADQTSPAIEPEGQYRIVIAKKIVVGDIKLLPRNDNIVKGTLLAEIRDQVEAFERVDV